MTPTFAPTSRSAVGRRGLAAAAAALAAVVLSLALLPAQATASHPPRGFVGLSGFGNPTGTQLSRVDGARVETYRQGLMWSRVEPYAPQGPDRTCPSSFQKTVISGRGHCYRWAGYDQVIVGAARRGIRVMPALSGSPRWVAPRPFNPPQTAAARQGFYDFARAAADRYGPNGYIWGPGIPSSARPLDWQIWNEPNTNVYWSNRPNASEYARLLRGASAAANAGDSAVRIVTAGMTFPAPSQGIDPRTFLRSMVRYDPNIKYTFSSLGLHPYAPYPSRVIEGIRLMRSTMNALRVSRPIHMTEIGWSSASPNGRLQVGSKQDDYLRELYQRLLGTGGYSSAARRYNVSGAIWFALQDINDPYLTWSKTTGLFYTNGNAKPSWSALKRVTGAP